MIERVINSAANVLVLPASALDFFASSCARAIRRTVSGNGALFAAIICAGMFLPSSTDGNVSKPLFALAFVLSAVLLMYLASKVGVDRDVFLCVSVAIPAWLIFCTLLTIGSVHMTDANPLAVFTLLGFIYSLRLRKFEAGDLKPILAAVSLVNIVLGLGMIFGGSVSAFMVAHYTNFYSDLVSSMVSVHKPVTVFATHSLAGTFSYLFFFLTFRTYRKNKSTLFLALAVLHALMCLALMSTSSLAFACLAFAELAWAFKKTAVALAVAVVLLIPSGTREAIILTVKAAMPGEGNGFAARYGPTGTVTAAIVHIADNPFSPMGLNYADNTGNVTDSGPLQYLLRGSAPLLLLIYGGLFVFLRRNLSDKQDLYRLFLVLLAAESGFCTLLYIRSLLLLPAFVIYLNSLRRCSE